MPRDCFILFTVKFRKVATFFAALFLILRCVYGNYNDYYISVYVIGSNVENQQNWFLSIDYYLCMRRCAEIVFTIVCCVRLFHSLHKNMFIFDCSALLLLSLSMFAKSGQFSFPEDKI